MPHPTYLADQWRQLSEQQSALGAEAQARTLEWCADQLEERFRKWENVRLALDQAAAESGYSRDHLSRLVREGTIPDAGEPHTARIRRRDLPRKPGHTSEPATAPAEPLGSREQMARSVVDSD